MAICYTGDCGEYAVAPMLVRDGSPTRCCEDPPMCQPCLPRCRKPEVVYCCERPRARSPPPLACGHYCDEFQEHRRPLHSCHTELRPARCCRKSPPPLPCTATSCPPADCCPVCSHTVCSPVTTKYVIPCYRYEDGRIDNQPTVLMRRACEVAVGVRPRREPFVKSSHSACNDQEVCRYHSEDERGNCYHFEKKKHRSSTDCCPYAPVKQQRGICQPSAQCCQYEYEDCVFASPCQPAKYYLHYHY